MKRQSKKNYIVGYSGKNIIWWKKKTNKKMDEKMLEERKYIT